MASNESRFTVEEANQRLPLVRVIVRDAVLLKEDILNRQSRLMELRERYPDDDDPDSSPYAEEVLEMEESLENDEILIDSYANELSRIGATLVDAVSGLVEFSSELDGQPVKLSWKYDDPEIAFWRSEHELPGNRRPLGLTSQQTS